MGIRQSLAFSFSSRREVIFPGFPLSAKDMDSTLRRRKRSPSRNPQGWLNTWSPQECHHAVCEAREGTWLAKAELGLQGGRNLTLLSSTWTQHCSGHASWSRVTLPSTTADPASHRFLGKAFQCPAWCRKHSQCAQALPSGLRYRGKRNKYIFSFVCFVVCTKPRASALSYIASLFIIF